MKHRWLAGIVLFSLGFGSAFLMRLTAADTPPKEGIVEGQLKFVDGAETFSLTDGAGGKGYLIVVTRNVGVLQGGEPLVSYKKGAAAVAKKDLQTLGIYRLTPAGVWQSGSFRPCNEALPDDCPLPRMPQPPPPPLQEMSHLFLGPATP